MSAQSSFDLLMQQTRKLAAAYYQSTGQVLPVSSEIAKYDAARLFNLVKPNHYLSSVDAVSTLGKKIQIKSRVLFKDRYTGLRVGQVNPEGDWEWILLVLMKANYEPLEIYLADRLNLEAIHFEQSTKRSKRGALSVSKFIALSQCIWSQADGKLIETL